MPIACDPARFVTLERAVRHGELCEELLLKVLDRLRGRLEPEFKTLREWCNRAALGDATARVRGEAQVVADILDLLGED